LANDSDSSDNASGNISESELDEKHKMTDYQQRQLTETREKAN